MAWQVGIVLDEQLDIAPLLGWLPVWAWSTTERRAAAEELRKSWGSLWYPEPALTLIDTPVGDDPVAALEGEIPTLEMHHSFMTAIRIFGVQNSSVLRERLSALGYTSLTTRDDDGLLFARPLNSLEDVPELELDATGWRVSDDIYDAFFKAVGAPSWHGRNFNALDDSISTGSINRVEVPYRVLIRNSRRVNGEAAAFLSKFAELINELNARGCPVELRMEK